MGQLLIRDVDDDIIARLTARAAARGRTLDQDLREMISTAASLPSPDLSSRDLLLAELLEIQAMTPDTPHRPTAQDLVRAGRDER